MLDDLDDGARVGVWTVLGVVAFLLFGLLGGLAMKTVNAKAKPAVAAAAPAAATAAAADTLVEGPLAGDVAGTLFFASGAAALPDDAAAAVAAIKTAADAAPGRKLVLSGFHDATGDPAKNAELAKERAKAVRAALQAAGIDAARLALRKPESTTGDGDEKQARRVEVRLLP
jgi:outer membrane protein OmpA-like peptidoglycan-associated protein